MLNNILHDKALASKYFITIKGMGPTEIIVPHEIANNTVLDNCDLLCRSLGIDLAKLTNAPTLHLLDKATRSEKHSLPFPEWDRGRGNKSSNVAFLLKSMYMSEGNQLSPGGMRSRLQDLVRDPHGLGALALIDKSPVASKAFSYALSKHSNKIRFVNGKERNGRGSLSIESPISFRADYGGGRKSHIRTSVDISETTSIIDAFSRVIYGASFDAALQASVSEIADTPIDELQNKLYSSKSTLAGYYNRAIAMSLGRAYQTVLLSSNELLDRGAMLIGSNDPRMTRLKEDVQAFRQGGLRQLNKDLAERAICWNTNESNVNLNDIRQAHMLNHYYSDGVSALNHLGNQEGIEEFPELAKRMAYEQSNKADRSTSYAYQAQKRGFEPAPDKNPTPKPRPKP